MLKAGCKTSALLQGQQLEQPKKKKKTWPNPGVSEGPRKELCVDGALESKEWYSSGAVPGSEDQILLAVTQRDLLLFEKQRARLERGDQHPAHPASVHLSH